MKKQTPEQMAKQHQKRMDECNGDFFEYLRRYNRHTLELTYTNEQLPIKDGKSVFKSITFLNQDNAFSHMSLVKEFISLITAEENKHWGYKQTSQELVDRIINPISDRLKGILDTYPETEEED